MLLTWCCGCRLFGDTITSLAYDFRYWSSSTEGIVREARAAFRTRYTTHDEPDIEATFPQNDNPPPKQRESDADAVRHKKGWGGMKDFTVAAFRTSYTDTARCVTTCVSREHAQLLLMCCVVLCHRFFGYRILPIGTLLLIMVVSTYLPCLISVGYILTALFIIGADLNQVLDKRRYVWIYLWMYNYVVITARLAFLMPYVDEENDRGALQVFLGLRKGHTGGDPEDSQEIPWELRWDLLFFMLLFLQRKLFMLPELGVVLARADREKLVAAKCVPCS